MSTDSEVFEHRFLVRPIVATDIGHAWHNVLGSIVDQGVVQEVRGKQTKELLNVQLTVLDLTQNILVNYRRQLNYRFMVAECLWIIDGRDDVEYLARFNSKMREFSDDGKTLAGAYGPRLQPQWSYIFNSILVDKASRQAVASIWTPNPPPSKDIPCTISFQFLIRDDRLNMVVNMRSSDVWLGLPYDFFTFSMCAIRLAEGLGLKPGALTMNLASSHLYQDHYVIAEQALFELSMTVRTKPLANLDVYRNLLETVSTSREMIECLENL